MKLTHALGMALHHFNGLVKDLTGDPEMFDECLLALTLLSELQGLLKAGESLADHLSEYHLGDGAEVGEVRVSLLAISAALFPVVNDEGIALTRAVKPASETLAIHGDVNLADKIKVIPEAFPSHSRSVAEATEKESINPNRKDTKV